MGVIMGELISHARAHEMFAYLDGGLIRMERTSARIKYHAAPDAN